MPTNAGSGAVRRGAQMLGAPQSGLRRMISATEAPMARSNTQSKSPPRSKPSNSGLRRFLEDRGLVSPAKPPIDFISRKEAAVPALSHALRRSRPPGKAKALAQERKALREQPATRDDTRRSQRARAASWAEAEQASSRLSFSASQIPSTNLPEAAAVATAHSYNFDVLLSSGRLPENWRWLEDREVIYIPQWPMQGDAQDNCAGSIIIFRSGCFVAWGMSSEHMTAFYREVLFGNKVPVEQERYVMPGDEALEYVILPDEKTRIVGDLIVLGQPNEDPGLVYKPSKAPSFTLQARLAFSQGLAASARLSVQESVLAKYVESVDKIPVELEASGKVPIPRRSLIRKLGTLLLLRQRLNLDRDNFVDDPELYWENSRMEGAYAVYTHY